MKKKFNFRGFISLFIVILFLIMSFSGIVLYVSPSGRAAEQAGWSLLNLSKLQWQTVHTIFTFVFIAAAMFHLFFNWRPLLAYFRRKINLSIRLRKEFLGAFGITIVLFILVLSNIPPFSNVMELRDYFKHPAIETSEELIETTPADSSGVCASEEEDNAACSEKAGESKNSPLSREKAVLQENGKEKQGEGKGFGRKTLSQLFADNNITEKEGLKKLSEKGIKAGGKEKVKNIAEKYNMRPTGINSILSGK